MQGVTIGQVRHQHMHIPATQTRHMATSTHPRHDTRTTAFPITELPPLPVATRTYPSPDNPYVGTLLQQANTDGRQVARVCGRATEPRTMGIATH